MANDDLKRSLQELKESVEKLAEKVSAILAHLEKQSGDGPEGAPEENDLDASGEPRQFD